MGVDLDIGDGRTALLERGNLALYQKVGFKEFKRERVTDNLEFIYLKKT